MNRNPIDLNAVLGSLKDFQRRTADFGFERLVLDPETTRRFLVADEVGLGKTLVARGIVARIIDHLWGTLKRIDIIYVCSNKDIARQNINRLKVTKDEGFTLATRLTLLARRRRTQNGVTDFRDNALNFISLTPGTSFDPQGTQLGEKSERVLLYHMLVQCWGTASAAAQNVFQGNAGVDGFRDDVSSFSDNYTVDPEVLSLFRQELQASERKTTAAGKPGLRARLDDLCRRFPRTKETIPREDRSDRNALVGELRRLLARACVRVLSPDLVILDEFQRFRHLLADDTEAGMLAHELFNFVDHESKSHVLLLSATPYKMYTITSEADEENHYEDFLKTLRFLLNSDAVAGEVAELLDEFRQELLRSAGRATPRLSDLRDAIEEKLKRVIARTERLAVSQDRNGMLREFGAVAEFEADDLRAYLDMQKVARVIEAPDVIEYWKSAPYLLNFMDDYQLKEDVVAALSNPDQAAELQQILSGAPGLLLSRASLEGGVAIPPRNPKLRELLSATTDRGAWRLMWVPPTCPYYELAGVFAAPELKGFTKRLVFSSWRVVPKAIASLVSHDAERRARAAFQEAFGRPPPEATEGGQSLLLRFARDRERDRPYTGMPNFTLLYPSLFFTERLDPKIIAAEVGGGQERPDLQGVRIRAEQILRAQLEPYLLRASTTGPKDEAWYWAAPLLLDLAHDRSATLAWLGQSELAGRWTGHQHDDDPDSAWADHVAHLRLFAESPWELGPPPDDLLQILAFVAIAGPANCASRALARSAGGNEKGRALELRNAAGRVGWAFRSHFNRPHVITIVRGIFSQESYWHAALDYCASGCLQAVLDEYAHVLQESLGLIQKDGADVAHAIADAMGSALALRPSNLKVDYWVPNPQAKSVDRTSGRIIARFALPLVEAQEEPEQDASRVEKVREAFNSPFWPFVVASTSIGQEGLDFHTYCHAIVHWNLPSNPVDMEQREGRIHRYKGHAIRKNIAAIHGASSADGEDPWARMFSNAVAARAPGQNDLVPYWVFPLADGAHIERHVQATPLSRDQERLEAIRRTMAVYRLVFGQPRQDDLVQYLIERNPNATADELRRLAETLNINLAP